MGMMMVLITCPIQGMMVWRIIITITITTIIVVINNNSNSNNITTITTTNSMIITNIITTSSPSRVLPMSSCYVFPLLVDRFQPIAHCH